MSVEQILYSAGLIGVAVFAISGALAAAEKGQDILAFILFGTVTGIGGGTVRDLILNSEQVFWVAEPFYLQICIGASVVTYFFARTLVRLHTPLLWMDAAGLALFCVVGTAKAEQLGLAPVVAIAMGMITPTFGSLIRDMMLSQEPVLLGPEIYVTAALLGSALYLGLGELGIAKNYQILGAIAGAFALRAAAIVWDLRLPKFSHAMVDSERKP